MPKPSPGNLRSPRKRALEIGTTAVGFPPEIHYDPHGGHPVTPDMPAKRHEGKPPAVGGTGEPIQSNPIK